MINEKKYVNVLSSPAEKTKEEVVIKNQDITVTKNGVYEAEAGYTGLGIVNVAVPTPRYYGIVAPLWSGQETTEESTPDFAGMTTVPECFAYQKFWNNDTIVGDAKFDTIQSIYQAGFRNAFSSTHITSVSFNNLSSISREGLYATFSDCPNLTGSVSFPALTTGIQSWASECFSQTFSGTKITSANFSNLVSVPSERCFANCFYNCEYLESINFNALTSVTGQNAFTECFVNTKLESIVFSALTTITGQNAFDYAFGENLYLRSLSFPALTTVGNEDKYIFSGMLGGVEGCTVHFPASLEATIGKWSDVLDGFGGTDTVVLFDL